MTPILEMIATEAAVKVGFSFAERAYEHVTHAARQTEFLCYDPRSLVDSYKDEPGRIAPDIPYTEEIRILDSTWQKFLQNASTIRVTRNPRPFVLAKAPPRDLSDFQAHARARFEDEGRLDRDRDESVVRLEKIEQSTKTLHIQKCDYTDGLRSNYAMDLGGHLKIGMSNLSFRSYLQIKYKRRLPPLADRRLSNAIGIAVVIWYKSKKGEVVPYLPRRAKPSVFSEILGTTRKQAVYPGGFHCTASGETMWEDRSSFHEIFTKDICRELQEEVGVAADDLAWIHPISLCREFLRGGKPQLFFTGFTTLSPREIDAKRRLAIREQKKKGRQEIEDEALIADTPDELYRQLWSHGTMESVVNMALALECAILAKRAKQFD